jgi:hypothetical protein
MGGVWHMVLRLESKLVKHLSLLALGRSTDVFFLQFISQLNLHRLLEPIQANYIPAIMVI